MNGLSNIQFQEVSKMINKQVSSSQSNLFFGNVTAVDEENRNLKVMLQQYEIETNWCKVLQGAFTDKIGMEVLVCAIKGQVEEQFVVMGIIE